MGGVQAGAADARAVHEGMPYSFPLLQRFAATVSWNG